MEPCRGPPLRDALARGATRALSPRVTARVLFATAATLMLLLSTAIWLVSGGRSTAYLPLQVDSYPVALVSISYFFYFAWWLTPQNCLWLQEHVHGGTLGGLGA